MNDTWIVDQIKDAKDNLEKTVESTDPSDTLAMFLAMILFVAAVAEALKQRE